MRTPRDNDTFAWREKRSRLASARPRAGGAGRDPTAEPWLEAAPRHPEEGIVSRETLRRVAVVTGGASGMGLGIVQRLARDGRAVAVFDLDTALLDAAVTELAAEGCEVRGWTVDVSDRAQVDDAIGEARAAFGPIEIMVTSAGIDRFEKFTEITLETWNTMLAVNLTGTFNCVQSAVADMLAAKWGRIVTISSSSAQSGAARMVHYVASKGGVVGFTKALALELAPHGITVNTIPPGFIITPMTRRAKDRGDLADLDAIIARTPVRRGGTAEDIAAACAFLCSDEASYITGQALNVNGGWYL
jgi:2-hydroxycyclohexanecarboxyl-CoA dehydrogenase